MVPHGMGRISTSQHSDAQLISSSLVIAHHLHLTMRRMASSPWLVFLVLICLAEVIATNETSDSVVATPSLRTPGSSSSLTPSKTKNLRGHYVLERSTEQLRDLNGYRRLTGPPSLVTPRCNVIRIEAYQAELQLVYSYLVEFATGKPRSLSGVEDAITYAVAQKLDECDEFDRPRYKIKTNTKHVFSKEKFCPPEQKRSTCHVVTGATAILLDSQFSDVQEEAYATIQKALNDTIFLEEFSANVVRAEFIKPLRQSLVLSPELDSPGQSGSTPGPVTATVAVAAASVSFVVASVFCYGLLRREHRHHPEPHIRHRNHRHHSLRTARMTVGNPMDMSKLSSHGSRRHFVRLEDLRMEDLPAPCNDFVAETSPTEFMSSAYSSSPPIREATPSITWSISDITSDCSSIISTLSRTTSKLERIEEEEEVGEEGLKECFEEDVDPDNDSSSLDIRRNNPEAQTEMETDRDTAFPVENASRRTNLEEFDSGGVRQNSVMEMSDLEGTYHEEDNMKDDQNDLRPEVTDDVEEIEEEEAEIMPLDDVDIFPREGTDPSMLGGSMERSRIYLEPLVEEEQEDSILAVSDEECASQANSSASELDLIMSLLDSEESIDLSSDALIITEGSSLTNHQADLSDSLDPTDGPCGDDEANRVAVETASVMTEPDDPENGGFVDNGVTDDNSREKYGTPRQDEDNDKSSTTGSEPDKKDFLDEWVSHIMEDSANLGRIEHSHTM